MSGINCVLVFPPILNVVISNSTYFYSNLWLEITCYENLNYFWGDYVVFLSSNITELFIIQVMSLDITCYLNGYVLFLFNDNN